ncbi:MAG: hypothetical protein ISS43_02500 [Candidatus Omnitrophica bacterium]|nr:hypothetical protein [Candidatus Omnitrophota bacterium]
MNTFMKILGGISIILGVILIILTWQYPFWVLGPMALGGIVEIFKGILAILLYALVTTGFIASGIGMFKRKSWAVVLFIILVIFWIFFLTLCFKDVIFVETPEGRHTIEEWQKQREEKVRRELEELQRQREYLRLQKKK